MSYKVKNSKTGWTTEWCEKHGVQGVTFEQRAEVKKQAM